MSETRPEFQIWTEETNVKPSGQLVRVDYVVRHNSNPPSEEMMRGFTYSAPKNARKLARALYAAARAAEGELKAARASL